MKPQNWAGNLTYRAARWHAPETTEQLQGIVSRCQKLKVLGSRHSFNDIADTTEDMLTLENFDQIVALDHEHNTVTVEANIRYGTLCQWLHHQGYALHNLASLPHISVAGACATATHGSGVGNGNLSTAVSAMEIVTANGKIRTVSRECNGEQFDGMVVGLGGLGVVTKLTLDIQPAFAMRQYVYENLPLSEMETHFEGILGYAYSVSLFTDWQTEQINQVWIKERIMGGNFSELEPIFFGAPLAERPLHPLISLPAANCTEQMGVPGAWHERLPHFRMEFTPSNGEELQSEYFVPRRHALAAIRAVSELREQLAPHLFISEIRTIAADTLWISPCYGQDSVAIHFTWKPNGQAVEALLPRIEAQLAPFGARPHWGKLFAMNAAELQSLYPKLPDFQRLLRAFDPIGKFHNAYLERYILGSSS